MLVPQGQPCFLFLWFFKVGCLEGIQQLRLVFILLGSRNLDLQSNLEPPWSRALFLSILCLWQPSCCLHAIPSPLTSVNPHAVFFPFPHALSVLTLAFACDYWKLQAPANREIYS